MSDHLTFWVIYYGASNHPPGKWVVRKQDAGRDGVRPHEDFFECDSLEEARAKVPEGLEGLEGLYRLPRFAEDDPVIVECWF